jgi:hypothetical protein
LNPYGIDAGGAVANPGVLVRKMSRVGGKSVPLQNQRICIWWKSEPGRSCRMNDPSLRDTAFLVFRIFCGFGLGASLLGGLYLYRNFDRFLGIDPEVPSESRGARGYTKMQVVAVWLHLVVFFGMGVLLLH